MYTSKHEFSKHELIPVVLALFFLIALDFHSNNLTAAPVTTDHDKQAIQLEMS